MTLPTVITDNIDPMQLDPVPSDLPEDTKYLGDRLDKIIALLADLEQATVRNETPAPGLFFAMALRNDFPQNVRVRTIGLLVSVSAAATVTVTIGSASLMLFDFSAADTIYLPLPTLIDSGTDVTVAVSAGTLRLAAFLGYPESDRP